MKVDLYVNQKNCPTSPSHFCYFPEILLLYLAGWWIFLWQSVRRSAMGTWDETVDVTAGLYGPYISFGGLLPPLLLPCHYHELQAIEVTGVVPQSSLLCGLVFSLAIKTLMIFHVLQSNTLYSSVLKSGQIYHHPPSFICFSVTQHPVKIYLALNGDVRVHKRNLCVPYVWLQMGNGNVKGHEGKNVYTLNISSVVRLSLNLISSLY